MNVYDFDGTIYSGDSTLDFFLFVLRREPSVWKVLPKQILSALKYFFRFNSKAAFKEEFYSFLNYLNSTDDLVKEFWNENIYKIANWYLEQKTDTDIIITASPGFLIIPLHDSLKIGDIIASEVDIATGKLLSNNCYGIEKVERFLSKYPNSTINNFYSDSKSDLPMARIACKAFYIKGRHMKAWNL